MVGNCTVQCKNLFHMEERVVLPQYSCSQGVKKRMGDVMRDLPQASEPLCATELLLGKANQASATLCKRSQRVLAHSAQCTQYTARSAQFTRST